VALTAPRADEGMQRGVVFNPFAYVEAAANLLTNAALNPVGKIPEFKYCAVRLEATQGRHTFGPPLRRALSPALVYSQIRSFIVQ